MIAFVDDLDVWLKLRKKIVQLSKAKDKVHASTVSNETTTKKEQDIVKEIEDEVLYTLRDSSLFLLIV